MADPIEYNKQFNFSDYQGNYPSKPLPGPHVDAELQAIEVATDSLRGAIMDLRAANGTLKAGTVGLSQLKPEVTADLNAKVAQAQARADDAAASASQAAVSAATAAAAAQAATADKISDAPTDGSLYGRASGTWVPAVPMSLINMATANAGYFAAWNAAAQRITFVPPPSGGGGGSSMPEPSPSDPDDLVPYGRAHNGSVGSWIEVPRLDHTHSIAGINGIALDGAPANRPLIWDGTNIVADQPLTTRRLTDVDPAQPTDGQILRWSASASRYVPVTPPAPGAEIPKGATRTGETTFQLTEAMFDTIIPIDLSGGDVICQVPPGLSYTSGTYRAVQFLIGPNVQAGAMLRFVPVSTYMTPTVLEASAAHRSSGVATTALNPDPSGADRRNATRPSGTDRVQIILVHASPADLAQPFGASLTVDGQAVNWTHHGNPGTAPGAGYTAGCWYMHASAIGSSSSDDGVIFVVTPTNLNNYTVVLLVLENCAQTSPTASWAHSYVNDPTSTSMTISASMTGVSRRLFYAAAKSNQVDTPATVVSGADVLINRRSGTTLNRSSTTVVVAHETGAEASDQSVTITWPQLNDVVHAVFQVKPAGQPGVEIRAPNNVAPNVGVPGRLVTGLYDGDAAKFNLVF